VAKCLSCIEEARCLKVKANTVTDWLAMWQQRLRPLPCCITSKMGMRSGMVSWYGIRICAARTRAGAIDSQLYNSGGVQYLWALFFCSTHGLQAVKVPYAADHNLTRLYQLSVITSTLNTVASLQRWLLCYEHVTTLTIQTPPNHVKLIFQLKPLKQRFSRVPLTRKNFSPYHQTTISCAC